MRRCTGGKCVRQWTGAEDHVHVSTKSTAVADEVLQIHSVRSLIFFGSVDEELFVQNNCFVLNKLIKQFTKPFSFARSFTISWEKFSRCHAALLRFVQTGLRTTSAMAACKNF
jgi:hypothetical protein